MKTESFLSSFSSMRKQLLRGYTHHSEVEYWVFFFKYPLITACFTRNGAGAGSDKRQALKRLWAIQSLPRRRVWSQQLANTQWIDRKQTIITQWIHGHYTASAAKRVKAVFVHARADFSMYDTKVVLIRLDVNGFPVPVRYFSRQK